MAQLRVSVVIAAYNSTWCVERALTSVMTQTRLPDEVLVCDDGSTDGTPDLVEDRYGPPVAVLRLPHRNASASRGEGLGRATGDWLAMMDADDVWFPEKLERQLDFITRHPEIRLVTSDGILESAEGVIRESWFSDYFDPVRDIVGDLAPLVIERCFLLLSSTMVERSVYREAGGMDPEFAHSYDYDLWVRVLSRHPGGLMAEPLVSYFSSPGGLSRDYEARARDDLRIMRELERDGRPDLRRRAALRAVLLEFNLGLMCLRGGRFAEGRARMRRSLARGPMGRRLMAAAGSLVPDRAVGWLMRSNWLKRRVARSRESRGRLILGDGTRDAA